ncbi:hypothetical protein CEUSTIGMA_g9499.t1, partial [Chlamydomonas eustigma]
VLMHANQRGAVTPYLTMICAALLRTAMVAHQRRGESDAVAHCLFQLLAVQPDAPEWSQVIG